MRLMAMKNPKIIQCFDISIFFNAQFSKIISMFLAYFVHSRIHQFCTRSGIDSDLPNLLCTKKSSDNLPVVSEKL